MCELVLPQWPCHETIGELVRLVDSHLATPFPATGRTELRIGTPRSVFTERNVAVVVVHGGGTVGGAVIGSRARCTDRIRVVVVVMIVIGL